MRTAATLLADAVTFARVDPAEVVAGRVSVRPVLGSNLVHRVERAGLAVAYVKQPGAASVLDLDDTVGVETRTLRRLAGRASVPALLSGDPDAIWTAAVAGVPLTLVATAHEAYTAHHAGAGLVERAAERLGRALAELHRVELDHSVQPARLPWPLHLGRRLPSMEGAAAGSACAEVLDELTTEPVASALAAAAIGWRPSTWIHGDLSAGNVVVADRATATLVDLEAAGSGDPDWDVVCAEAALAAVDPRSSGEQAINQFRVAYGRAGGPGRSTAALRCARDLMTAWQYAAAQHGADSRATDLTPDRSAVHTQLARGRANAHLWMQESA